jgi:PEGA domain
VRRTVRITGFILLCLSWQSRSDAAPEVTAESKAQARDLDASAVKLAKSGAMREAIAAVQKSEALYPTARTLRKLAELQQQNTDFAAAYDTLSTALSQFDATLRPAERKDIAASLAELAAITGSIHVKVADAEAKIDVDGVPIGDGPLDKSVRVNLGSHVVHVVKAESMPFESKVEVAAGAEREVVAVLEPKPGTLVVRVQGPPAHVRVDGIDVGPAPTERKVPPGHHVVEIGEAASLVRKDVEVGPGANAEVELVYRGRARIVIHSEPTGGHVTLDGESKGDAPFTLEVPAGRHELKMTLEGYAPATETLELNGTESRSSTFNLTALPVPPSYKGVYGQVNLAFVGAPTFDNTLTDACNLSPTACHGSTPDLGATIPVRVGYSFGQLGIEVVSACRFDIGGRDLRFGANATANTFFYGFTVVNAVAVRWMPEAQGARFSAGLGLGWAHEIMGVTASTHNVHVYHPVANGDAPIVLMDAAVLAGDTPGAKFRFGLEVQIQFDSSNGFVDSKFPDDVLARNTQVFLGPAFGVQFGH